MAQAMAPGIHVKDTSLQFDKKVIFDGFNINFPAKQWTCLLGESGVGKTSLLRLIGGLIRPGITKSVQVTANIESTDHQPLCNRVTYMAQDDLLMPWLNILDNVLLSYRLRAKTPPDLKQKAYDLLEQVGLGQEAHQKPHKLSKGMRQRASLARTLLEQKPIVLMDEPFCALDALTRLKLQDLSAQLLKNHTVILVTHDPIEALRLGHIIKVLRGSPVEVSSSIVPYSNQLPRPVDDPQIPQFQNEIFEKLLSNKEPQTCVGEH